MDYALVLERQGAVDEARSLLDQVRPLNARCRVIGFSTLLTLRFQVDEIERVEALRQPEKYFEAQRDSERPSCRVGKPFQLVCGRAHTDDQRSEIADEVQLVGGR